MYKRVYVRCCRVGVCQNWLPSTIILCTFRNVSVLMVLIATTTHTHLKWQTSKFHYQVSTLTPFSNHHILQNCRLLFSFFSSSFFLVVHCEICFFFLYKQLYVVHSLRYLFLSSMFLTFTVERGSSSSYDRYVCLMVLLD